MIAEEDLSALTLRERFAAERPAMLQLLNETKDRAGAPRLNRLAADTFQAPIDALSDAGTGPNRLDVRDADVRNAVLATLIGLGQLVASGAIGAGDIDRVVGVAIRAVLTGLRQAQL